MSRIAYVNGQYVRRVAARVSIDDRAFQFGDGVYEAFELRGGKIIDEEPHLGRLERSLKLVRIPPPLAPSALRAVLREVVLRNRVSDGILYLQVSRGVAPRDHAFPTKPTRPGLVVTARALDPTLGEARAASGVKVITRRDDRWAHPHVKTLQLLPNVLAKQAAREVGAYEAWFVDENGAVTEGASTNAWIVTADGRLVTRQADEAILHGVTRATLIALIDREGLRLEERPFTLEEAFHAAEAFFSSATNIATPVIAIDDRAVGDGKPGAITLNLRRKFHEMARKS